MKQRLKLNDCFPDWLTDGGIFSVLQSFPVPWASLDIATSLDFEYHGNVSGEKNISPLVDKIREDVELTQAEQTALATAIMAICGTNWAKQWETLEFEYNPIENYSMVEEMTNDRTVEQYGKTRITTNNLSHTKTGTETNSPDITETTTPDLTATGENSVYGFNSVNPVPSNETEQNTTGTNTVERTGTETLTHNVTDSDTGTQTNNDGGSDTRTRNYHLTRSGNIGVTTSQQMIESERNLWVWNFFHDVVFPDVDRVLTIQTY